MNPNPMSPTIMPQNASRSILHRGGAFARGIRAENAPLHDVWDALSSLPQPEMLPDGVMIDGAFHPSDGSFKTVTRDANGKIHLHGTVTGRYAAIGHREALAPLFSAIADAGLTEGSRASWYSTPSKLGGDHGHVRAVVWFPDQFTIQTGSGPTTLGLIGHNSLDGSGGVTLDAAGGVWVCSNRNIWGDLLGRASVRHVGDASKRVAECASFLDKLPTWIPEIQAVFSRAGEIEIPRIDAIPLLVSVGLSERPARKIAENLPTLLTGPQARMFDGSKLTLEGLYNAGTAFYTHHYDRSVDGMEAGLENLTRLLLTARDASDAFPVMIEEGRAKLSKKKAATEEEEEVAAPLVRA